MLCLPWKKHSVDDLIACSPVNVYDYLCHSGNIAVREKERHFFVTYSKGAQLAGTLAK